jgi:hypothetical protein
MGLFKPEWQSKNVQKALEAIERLDDQKKLARAATFAGRHIEVRVAAIKKLSDQAVLKRIALDSQVETHSDLCDLSRAAIETLSDQASLEEIALHYCDSITLPYHIIIRRKSLACAAAEKLTSATVIAQVIIACGELCSGSFDPVHRVISRFYKVGVASIDDPQLLIRLPGVLGKNGAYVEQGVVFDRIRELFKNHELQRAHWKEVQQVINNSHNDIPTIHTDRRTYSGASDCHDDQGVHTDRGHKHIDHYPLREHLKRFPAYIANEHK